MLLLRDNYYYNTDSNILVARIKLLGPCPMMDIDADMYVTPFCRGKKTKPSIIYLYGQGGPLTCFGDRMKNEFLHAPEKDKFLRIDSKTAEWLYLNARYGKDGVDNFYFDPALYDRHVPSNPDDYED